MNHDEAYRKVVWVAEQVRQAQSRYHAFTRSADVVMIAAEYVRGDLDARGVRRAILRAADERRASVTSRLDEVGSGRDAWVESAPFDK